MPTENSAGNKEQAINAVRQLIGAKKVPLILGPTLSNEMFAAGPVVNGRKIPIIGTFEHREWHNGYRPYVFRTSLPKPNMVPVTLRMAKKSSG